MENKEFLERIIKEYNMSLKNDLTKYKLGIIEHERKENDGYYYGFGLGFFNPKVNHGDYIPFGVLYGSPYKNKSERERVKKYAFEAAITEIILHGVKEMIDINNARIENLIK